MRLPMVRKVMTKQLTVSPSDAGRRLDQYLSEVCEITRSMAQKLCEEGNVLRGGKIAS
ncbi:MAG: hypothetical protein IJ955_04810, partial [Oscillospiraceae bacterium]|nr:hypothetical protein [Oscillospiraceae bacterium]